MHPSSSTAEDQDFTKPESMPHNPRRRQSCFGPNLSTSAPICIPQAASGHLKPKRSIMARSALVPSVSTSTSRRRFVSMPQPLPSASQVNVKDLDYHHNRPHHHYDHHKLSNYLASPPIIDFTRFEDTYRGPRDQSFEGLVISRRNTTTTAKMRSSSTGVKLASKADSMSRLHGKGMTRTKTSRNVVTSSPPGPPQLASERKPDPRVLLGAVHGILQANAGALNNPDGNLDWRDYLDKDELLATHQLDQLDFEEREGVSQRLEKTGTLEVRGLTGALTVLGEPIRKASIYASTTMILGGKEHQLPILAVQCVEELYRTGIYQPNLFRMLPNRARLLELINIFDSADQIPGSLIRSRRESPRSGSSAGGSRKRVSSKRHSNNPQVSHSLPPDDELESSTLGFGNNTSLHLESTSDICALLTTYLSSLPEPIMHQKVFDAIWDLCGIAEEDDEENSDDDSEDEFEGGGYSMRRKPDSSFRCRHHPATPSTPGIAVPLARTFTTPAENTQIALAQLLLHLLPSPNFSLIVYLLAFFSQVALVREENGVGVEDLSRMFGGRIFGGQKVPMTGRNKSRTYACPSPPPSYSSSPSKYSRVQDADDDDDAEETNKAFNTTQTRRQGETMMTWFLRRWGSVSEGLFDIVEDAKMEVFGPITVSDVEPGLASSTQQKRRPVGASLRKDSFGDVLTMRDVDFELEEEEAEEERQMSKYHRGRDERRHGSGGSGSGSSGSRRRKTPTQPEPRLQPPIQRQPRAQARTPRPSQQTLHPDQVDETPQSHSTPRRVHTHSRAFSRGDAASDIFDDDYVVLPKQASRTVLTTSTCSGATTTDESFYSLPSVDERLMDVSMPRFLMNDTTMMNSFSSPDSESSLLEEAKGNALLHPSTSQAGPSRRSSHLEEPLKDTDLLVRITQLEKDLRDRTAALSDALADLATSRKEYAFLATKMSELEMEYDSPPSTPPKASTQKHEQQEEHHEPPYRGHFVEHLEDGEDDTELKRYYADVYDAMGLSSGGIDDSSSRKPTPRN